MVVKILLTLVALLMILGCTVAPKPISPQPVTTQPGYVELTLKTISEGQVRTDIYTHCDFCKAPIAASTKEELLKQMTEAGWCLDQFDDVVCRRCTIEIGKMGFH